MLPSRHRRRPTPHTACCQRTPAHPPRHSPTPAQHALSTQPTHAPGSATQPLRRARWVLQPGRGFKYAELVRAWAAALTLGLVGLFAHLSQAWLQRAACLARLRGRLARTGPGLRWLRPCPETPSTVPPPSAGAHRALALPSSTTDPLTAVLLCGAGCCGCVPPSPGGAASWGQPGHVRVPEVGDGQRREAQPHHGEWGLSGVSHFSHSLHQPHQTRAD